jgi:hypothetical protein
MLIGRRTEETSSTVSVRQQGFPFGKTESIKKQRCTISLYGQQSLPYCKYHGSTVSRF